MLCLVHAPHRERHHRGPYKFPSPGTWSPRRGQWQCLGGPGPKAQAGWMLPPRTESRLGPSSSGRCAGAAQAWSWGPGSRLSQHHLRPWSCAWDSEPKFSSPLVRKPIPSERQVTRTHQPETQVAWKPRISHQYESQMVTQMPVKMLFITIVNERDIFSTSHQIHPVWGLEHPEYETLCRQEVSISPCTGQANAVRTMWLARPRTASLGLISQPTSSPPVPDPRNPTASPSTSCGHW